MAYVSSVDALERAKKSPGCIYIRPPIDAYGTLDFAKFEEICKVGYEFGKAFLREAEEKGQLPINSGVEGGRGRSMRRMVAPRRASV